MKPMDRSYKHRDLFDAGVRALQGFGVVGEAYRCPICCSDYDARAIKKDAAIDYRLTLEHAPPASVGGKVVALTCKKCNNELGSKLDSQISAREQFFRFIDPNRPDPKPFPGKITLSEDPTITTNIQISGKIGSKINVRAGKNNKPSHLSGTREKIAEIYLSQRSFNGKISVPTYDKKRAKLAFLKNAFLCLFAKFGYTYALSQPARYIVQGFLEESDFDVVMLQPIDGYENSILVNEKTGVCFVGFGEFLLVCPWVNASVPKYAEACKNPDSFLGKYDTLYPFEMPIKLEAILDNRLIKKV
ncbi:MULTISPECIES: HNH endonuclease [Pacificibacter]|uniref:HNH endonuclease n=1 Tax=Pacificibacter TaxID=1042323 RepID=UPI001C09805D|nr:MULTISPECIES: HNH endonuclease [Pacificibacter]MBU2936504.1 HNH endonuclease [Pacificibacter marinus]MDO6614694.1 HNH endonuclease [Pacificibacter sp. 1_MG-2023]